MKGRETEEKKGEDLLFFLSFSFCLGAGKRRGKKKEEGLFLNLFMPSKYCRAGGKKRGEGKKEKGRKRSVFPLHRGDQEEKERKGKKWINLLPCTRLKRESPLKRGEGSSCL